jgi:ADP-ribose pyrophosphatase YjhB (NUDIX family)
VFRLDNNHFDYHLQRLLKNGQITKNGNLYSLTSAGLKLANQIDTNDLTIVNQPKLGVLICVTKLVNNQKLILLGKRLKNPNINKIGFYASKVRLGESIYQSANRCLIEEVGLECLFTYSGTVRIIDPENDRLMIYLKAKPVSTNYLPRTTRSINKWFPVSQIEHISHTFNDFSEDLKLFFSNSKFFSERTVV